MNIVSQIVNAVHSKYPIPDEVLNDLNTTALLDEKAPKEAMSAIHSILKDKKEKPLHKHLAMEIATKMIIFNDACTAAAWSMGLITTIESMADLALESNPSKKRGSYYSSDAPIVAVTECNIQAIRMLAELGEAFANNAAKPNVGIKNIWLEKKKKWKKFLQQDEKGKNPTRNSENESEKILLQKIGETQKEISQLQQLVGEERRGEVDDQKKKSEARKIYLSLESQLAYYQDQAFYCVDTQTNASSENNLFTKISLLLDDMTLVIDKYHVWVNNDVEDIPVVSADDKARESIAKVEEHFDEGKSNIAESEDSDVGESKKKKKKTKKKRNSSVVRNSFADLSNFEDPFKNIPEETTQKKLAEDSFFQFQNPAMSLPNPPSPPPVENRSVANSSFSAPAPNFDGNNFATPFSFPSLPDMNFMGSSHFDPTSTFPLPNDLSANSSNTYPNYLIPLQQNPSPPPLPTSNSFPSPPPLPPVPIDFLNDRSAFSSNFMGRPQIPLAQQGFGIDGPLNSGSKLGSALSPSLSPAGFVSPTSLSAALPASPSAVISPTASPSPPPSIPAAPPSVPAQPAYPTTTGEEDRTIIHNETLSRSISNMSGRKNLSGENNWTNSGKKLEASKVEEKKFDVNLFDNTSPKSFPNKSINNANNYSTSANNNANISGNNAINANNLYMKMVHLEEKLKQRENELLKLVETIEQKETQIVRLERILEEKDQNLMHAKNMWMKESSRASNLCERLSELEESHQKKIHQVENLSSDYNSAVSELRQFKMLFSNAPVSPLPSISPISPPLTTGAEKFRHHLNQPVSNANVSSISALHSSPFPAASPHPSASVHPAPASLVSGFSAVSTSPPMSSPSTNASRLSHLLLKDKGVLYEDDMIQIGVQMNFNRGTQPTKNDSFLLFIGNKSGFILSNFDIEFQNKNDETQIHLNLVQNTQISQILPKKQHQILAHIFASQPFLHFPLCHIKFIVNDNTPKQILLKLPIGVTKYISPLEISSFDFRDLWDSPVMISNQVQQVINLNDQYKNKPAIHLVHAITMDNTRFHLISLSHESLENLFFGGQILTWGEKKYYSLIKVELLGFFDTDSYQNGTQIKMTIQSNDFSLSKGILSIFQILLGEAHISKSYI